MCMCMLSDFFCHVTTLSCNTVDLPLDYRYYKNSVEYTDNHIDEN